jgi:hypothetical protein
MNYRASLLIVWIAAVATVSAQQLAPNAPKDQPVGAAARPLSAFEKAIAPHLEEARKTYPEAKKRFVAGLPAKHHFFVTTRIKDPDGKFEQVFIYVISIDDEKHLVTGRIANPLDIVKTYKPRQTITFT